MKYPGGLHSSSTFSKLWPLKIYFATVLTDPTYLAVRLWKTKNVLTLFLFHIWPADELIRYHAYLLVFKIWKCIFRIRSGIPTNIFINLSWYVNIFPQKWDSRNKFDTYPEKFIGTFICFIKSVKYIMYMKP